MHDVAEFMDVHDVAEFMKAHEPFSNLDATDLDRLAERRRCLRASEVVVAQPVDSAEAPVEAARGRTRP